MRRFRTHIVISGLILANLVFANVVFAQTSTTTTGIGITAADLKVVDDKIAILNQVKAANNGNETQAVIDARKTAMQACASLGNKILSITKGSGSGQFHNISTVWTVQQDNCNFGEWNSATGGVDIMAKPPYSVRTDSVYSSPDPRISGLWGKIKTDSSTFSQTTVQAADTAQNGGSTKATDWSVLLAPVNFIITSIFNLISSVLLALVSLAGTLLNFAIQKATTGEMPSFVDVGWPFIRDLMNMFFILALIVISIGTILRRESLNGRKLILNLILMALLINFSKVIAETLISGVNIIIKLFASNYVGYGTYWKALVDGGNSNTTFFLNSNGVTGAVAASLIKVFTILLIAASYGAIAILLLIRYIGLAVLVMVSPAAYAMSILPRTAGFAKQWWGLFIKYLTWAPVSMFFLYIGQTFIKVGSTLTTNGMFDALFIAMFFWAAIYAAKQAGMAGSSSILKAADGFWNGGGKMVNRWAMRGRPLALLGERLEKGGVIAKDGKASKAFSAWQRGAQSIEAVKPTAKEYLAGSEKQYQRGVVEKKENALYRLGVIEDEEMLKNPKNAQKLYTDKLKSDKFTVSDMHELVEKTSRKALPGAIEALKEVEDVDMRREANIALMKKLDERNAMPGTDLLRELPFGPTAPGDSGFRYVDSDDHSKGMYLEYFRQDRNNPGQIQPGPQAHQTRRYNAQEKADELSIVSPEKRQELEVKYNKAKEDLKKLNDRRTALQNDPDANVKILKAQTTGEVLDPGKERAAQEIVDGYEGVGPRVDLEKSIVTDTGRVFINVEAAEAMGLGPAQDTIIPKEEVEQFKQILREHGGVTRTEIQKLDTAVTNNLGIQVQRGVSKPIAPIIRELMGPDDVKNLRVAQRQEGEHEGIHRFADFIRESNKQLYDQLINKIMSTDKFDELKKQIQSIPEYAKHSNEQIAEEIIASQKFRDQLGSNVLTDINSSIQTLRKDYIKAVFNTARANKITNRSDVLARNIASRNPELSQETNFIIRRI